MAARKSLLQYARICDPNWQPSLIHKKIAQVLEDAITGKGSKRLVLTTPPQNGKSRMTSVELPTWYLGHNPRHHVIIASYAAGLAVERSMESRERFKHPMFREIFPGIELSSMKASAEYWANNQWGTFKAVGVGGSMTGRPGDLIIIDDPFKDYAEAHSEATRESVWNWFQSVVMTRIKPTSIIIVTQTRWHIDDLAGRLLDPDRQKAAGVGQFSERYELVRIPAICDDAKTDPLGREIGESSWPERYPKEFYVSVRAVTLDYIWVSMHQGLPVRKGGNYVNVDRFQVCDPEEVPKNARWCRFWDLAATEDQMNDFTAGVKGCMGPPLGWKQVKDEPTPKTTLYLADMIDVQFEWPKARERIKSTGEIERIEVGVEAVGGFKTAFSNLKEKWDETITLREYGVDKDKFKRALPWFSLVHNSQVVLVRGEWINRFKAQCESFPKGDHDDMIDAVSGVYEMVSKSFPYMIA